MYLQVKINNIIIVLLGTLKHVMSEKTYLSIIATGMAVEAVASSLKHCFTVSNLFTLFFLFSFIHFTDLPNFFGHFLTFKDKTHSPFFLIIPA